LTRHRSIGIDQPIPVLRLTLTANAVMDSAQYLQQGVGTDG